MGSFEAPILNKVESIDPRPLIPTRNPQWDIHDIDLTKLDENNIGLTKLDEKSQDCRCEATLTRWSHSGTGKTHFNNFDFQKLQIVKNAFEARLSNIHLS